MISKRTRMAVAATGAVAAVAVAGGLLITAGTASAGDESSGAAPGGGRATTTSPVTSSPVTSSPVTSGPARSGLKYPGTTDDVWLRGYDRGLQMVSFSDAYYLPGGPDNGHWDAVDRTARLPFAPDARFYSALQLCPTADGVTLDKNGTGSTRCDRTTAIASIAEHRVAIVRITVNAKDQITAVREHYQP